MNITTIRTLPQRTAYQALVKEQACIDLMADSSTFMAMSLSERAEVSLHCAKARAFTAARRQDAAVLADKAYGLALNVQDYVLAMEAKCFYVYCLSRHMTLEWFNQQVSSLRYCLDYTWANLGAEQDVLDAATEKLAKLESFGERLTAERTWTLRAA